jgi:hypothetical protein
VYVNHEDMRGSHILVTNLRHFGLTTHNICICTFHAQYPNQSTISEKSIVLASAVLCPPAEAEIAGWPILFRLLLMAEGRA